VFVGESINLTVEYSPNVSAFKWDRLNAPLPPDNRSIIINGANHSSLILSNITTDDWGLYIFTATSCCGTSSVNTTIKVATGEVCSFCVLCIL